LVGSGSGLSCSCAEGLRRNTKVFIRITGSCADPRTPGILSERCGRVVDTPASYSGGPGFISWLRRPAFLIEGFSVFFSVPPVECRDNLKIGPLPLPTESFPIRHHSRITLSSTLYSLLTEKASYTINQTGDPEDET
jgi:hypothetical protein